MKGSLLMLERQLRVYRHTWRSSAISTFLNPVLFLLAMGVGLGSLVDARGGPEGLPYLTWIAPGLLAAAAMQTAAGDSSYPVMAGIKWIKSYNAALASPLEIRHIVGGHIAWVALRSLQVSIVYAIVMWLFGATSITQSLLSVPPALLTGLAFAGPVTAYTARLQRETGLASMFRFVVTPLFLFSGTFFPIEQLPDWMEPVAILTPLWHGVELTRSAALGIDSTLGWLPHVTVLVACCVIFSILASRLLERRLVV